MMHRNASQLGEDESSNSSVFLDRRPTSRVAGATTTAGASSSHSSSTATTARVGASSSHHAAVQKGKDGNGDQNELYFLRSQSERADLPPMNPNMHVHGTPTTTRPPTSSAAPALTLLAPAPPMAPMKRSEMGAGLSYSTPVSSQPPSHSNPSMLYEQLTRAMPPPKRLPTRLSNASSSGWGSPKVSLARASLSTTASSSLSEQEEVESMAAGASSLLPPPRGGPLFGSPRTPSGGRGSGGSGGGGRGAAAAGGNGIGGLSGLGGPIERGNIAAPMTTPLRHKGRGDAISMAETEEQQSVVNGSGLLGLSPAVHGLSRLRIGLGAAAAAREAAAREKREREKKSRLSRPRRTEDYVDTSVLIHSSPPTSSPPPSMSLPTEEMEDGMTWHGNGDAIRGKLFEHEMEPNEDRRALLDLMRLWREDAMKHHLYETAIFWGDKVLSLETSMQAWTDAYHLATAFFLTHRYAQAEHLLCSPLRNFAQEEDLATGDLDDGVLRESDELAAEERQQGGSDGLEQEREGGDGEEEGEGEEDLATSDEWNDASEEGLEAALQATRNSSRLPATLFAKMEGVNVEELPSTDQYDMEGINGHGLDHLGRKRKDRNFTVSGTGTGSEANSGTGSTDSGGGEPPPGIGGAAGQPSEDVVKEAWKQEQRLALLEIRRGTPPSPDGVKLIDISSPARYLAAQCLVRQAKYHEALDLLNSERLEEERYGPKVPCQDGGIKLASSKWHLRGLIQLRLHQQAEAQQSFIRALSLDVKNFEAFDQLVSGQLLSAKEQWDFIQGLEYVAQAGDDRIHLEALQLVKLVYTTRLDKSGRIHAQQAAAARRQLYRLYQLDNNADVLLGLAEELFARQRYKDCHIVTKRIMELSKDHEAALTIHISTMVYLDDLRPTLFLLAHHLSDRDPDLPAAWYAVGCWYLASQRYSEARRYFSKAVSLNPRYAASWVAFAHCFASEGESDRAIIAYTTSERMFSTSHLPKLFIGMEHLHQGNLILAEMSLQGSALVWEDDALARNERGVVAYYKGDFQTAIHLFEAALEAADEVQMPASLWAPTHLNLGYAYRRSGLFERARKSFIKAMELDPECTPAHTGLAMVYHREGYLDEAVSWYEKAQLLSPRDKQVKELLTYALDELAQAAPVPLFQEMLGQSEEEDHFSANGANGEAGDPIIRGGPMGSSLLMSSANSISSTSASSRLALGRLKAKQRGLGLEESQMSRDENVVGIEEEQEGDDDDEEMDQGEIEAESILEPQFREGHEQLETGEEEQEHSHSQSPSQSQSQAQSQSYNSSAMELSANMSMDESYSG